MRNITASPVELTEAEAADTVGGEIFRQPFVIPQPPRPPIYIQPVEPPVAGTWGPIEFTTAW